MSKLLKFKSIRSKMIAGFSVVILLIIGLGILAFAGLTIGNNDTRNIIEEQLPLLIADETVTSKNAQRLAAARGYLLTGDSQFKEDFNIYTEEAEEAQALILETTNSAEVKELIDKTVEWREIIINEVITTYDQGNEEEALRILTEKAVPLGEELTDGYQEMVTAREMLITEVGEESIVMGDTILSITTIVSIIAIVISIVVALVVSNIITKPIIKVMDRMKVISNGDLTSEPLEVTTQDETGQLTVATNTMSDNMREVLDKIQMVSHTVSSQSEELTQSSNEVMTGTEQVASTMQELAAGSETQANNASDLSSKMGIFTEKVQETNEDGSQIQTSSNEVLDMTNEGAQLMRSSMEQMARIDEIVHQAVDKVEGLDTHTQEISELVSVIQDIADQTNLLALNASIEAARAGEHGKGFAVVADEVGKLAEQSSNSVTNITDIVNRIQGESSIVVSSLKEGYHDVAQGTEEVTTTGKTFERIQTAVIDTVDKIAHMTTNLIEIAENNEQMNMSIQEIAAVSEESAAGVEETTASTEQTSSAMQQVAASSDDLAKLAEELNQLINQFKI